MSGYSTAQTLRVPIDDGKVIALMHRDALIVIEVTRVPWESGDSDERIEQAIRLLKADADERGDNVTWRYTGKPIALDPSWWPLDIPKKE